MTQVDENKRVIGKRSELLSNDYSKVIGKEFYGLFPLKLGTIFHKKIVNCLFHGFTSWRDKDDVLDFGIVEHSTFHRCVFNKIVLNRYNISMNSFIDCEFNNVFIEYSHIHMNTFINCGGDTVTFSNCNSIDFCNFCCTQFSNLSYDGSYFRNCEDWQHIGANHSQAVSDYW